MVIMKTQTWLLAVVMLTFLVTTIMPTTSDARCRRWKSVNGERATTLYRGVTYWIRSSKNRLRVYDNNGYWIGSGYRGIRVRPRRTGTFWITGYNTSMKVCW